jgi:hypothetical protein
MWADLTIMDLDPCVVGTEEPGALLNGSVLGTISRGTVIY